MVDQCFDRVRNIAYLCVGPMRFNWSQTRWQAPQICWKDGGKGLRCFSRILMDSQGVFLSQWHAESQQDHISNHWNTSQILYINIQFRTIFRWCVWKNICKNTCIWLSSAIDIASLNYPSIVLSERNKKKKDNLHQKESHEWRKSFPSFGGRKAKWVKL